VLVVIRQQLAGEFDQTTDPGVGKPVVDDPVLAPRLDEATPAQAGQVVGDARLRDSEPLDDLADRELLALGEGLEDAKPRAVGKDAEVLREQIDLARLGRDRNGPSLGGPRSSSSIVSIFRNRSLK
jgi:hypothetical protein